MTSKKVCDEQLILCYRQNSKEAYELLLKRKHANVLPLLKKYLQQCRNFGADMYDIYAVFLESFHRAIKRFIFEFISFQTYFLKVLNRDLAGFYRVLANPNDPRNNCLSLDQEVSYDSNLTMHDVLLMSCQKVDARNFTNINDVNMIIDADPSCKKEEITKRIVVLKTAGYSLIEISHILNLKVGAVRRKLQHFYENEDGNLIRKCLL
jgi:hypothetical protein